jgi:hypothetical protein
VHDVANRFGEIEDLDAAARRDRQRLALDEQLADADATRDTGRRRTVAVELRLMPASSTGTPRIARHDGTF